tara:strand:+ start:90 stop:788 length:699 start_codon:yes stop_codon:yes gene_type:complete
LSLNNIKIIIPSYNCTNKFISVIRKLRVNNITSKIYIVDDNSSIRSKLIINFIKNKFSNIDVLTNNKNLGQGGSIKKAFKVLKKKDDLICTMDDDGQHETKDVKKIINKANKIYFNNHIIFGSRELGFSKTPFNSYIGNKVSKFIFFLITKKKIIDTQTGLRFYSKLISNKFIKIRSNGFDFHNMMNYFLIKNKIKYMEVNIQTIYFDKNKKTRFKGLKDSIRILKQIFNFN